MTNDPPSTLRMGFGFQQARAAGAPYVAPATPEQMNFHLRERAAQKRLRSLRLKMPLIGSRIREYVHHEVNGYRLTAQQILFVISCEVAAQSKNGFVIHASDGNTYTGETIKEIFVDGVSFNSVGKSIHFHISFVKDIVPLDD